VLLKKKHESESNYIYDVLCCSENELVKKYAKIMTFYMCCYITQVILMPSPC